MTQSKSSIQQQRKKSSQDQGPAHATSGNVCGPMTNTDGTKTRIGAAAEKRPRHRKPTSDDVLCGRGGGINSHIGNANFRTMVREKKEAYNLATSKKGKAEIAQDVIDAVARAGGFFLQRDSSSSAVGFSGIKGSWVEVDHERALAKTSQALREGAPVIRERVRGGYKTKSRRTGGTRSKLAAHKARRALRKTSRSNTIASDGVDTKPKPKKEVIHPLIRGFADGHSRGKQLIPVASTTPTPEDISRPLQHDQQKWQQQQQEQEQETLAFPDRKRIASECPTPPPPPETPTLLSLPPFSEPSKFYSRPDFDPSSVVHMEMEPDGNHSGLELPTTPQSVAMSSNNGLRKLEALSVLDPTDFPDVAKPDIRCVRVPSLTPSEWGLNAEEFSGDEPFKNPFDSESNHHQNIGIEHLPINIDSSASSHSSQSINRINKILRSHSSSYAGNGNGNGNGTKSPSGHDEETDKNNGDKKTLRSFMSDLIDIENYEYHYDDHDQDFHEGLQNIYEAVHPGLTAPEKWDPIPTHLSPYSKTIKGSPSRKRSFSSHVQ